MANHLIAIDMVGREIKARVEAGDKALDKAEQHYIAAGIQLLEAQKRLKETREMRWSAFLFTCCKGMSDDTARRYMSLANGDTTLEEIREKTAAKVKAHRERKKNATATQAISGKSSYVTGVITKQNQRISNSPDRIARIVEAMQAAGDDVLSKIEALLNITEENVNG